MNRFHRQLLLAAFTPEGQARLMRTRVALVGLGALGSIQAELLVRAGVKHLILVDRDVVEETNLQRQHLYTEEDLGWPKAERAAHHLRAIWHAVEPVVYPTDLSPDTIHTILQDAELILDGTDNWATRWLINDFAVQQGIPWIYGGAVGNEGLVMAIRPGQTACLSCVFPPPSGQTMDACDRVGVWNTLTTLVGTLQVQLALELLLGHEVPASLFRITVHPFQVRTFQVHRRKDCPVCVHRRFQALEGAFTDRTLVLCGRDTVQIRPPQSRRLDLEALARRLQALGRVERRGDVLRLIAPEGELTLFSDGRALIRCPDCTPERARSLYVRWVGG